MACEIAVLVVGPPGVGKSSLVRRFVERAFPTDVRPTIGFEAFPEAVLLDPVKDENLAPEVAAALPPNGLQLVFWEIGGKERHRQAPRGRRADGLLLCYDVGDRASFFAAAHRLLEHRMDRHLACEVPSVVSDAGAVPRLPVVLCGTKADSTEPGAVTRQEALDFAAQNGVQLALVTSAVTGEGVDAALLLCLVRQRKPRQTRQLLTQAQ